MVLKLGNQCVQMFRATLDSRIYSPVSILETWPTSYTVALDWAARNTHMHPAPSTQHPAHHITCRHCFSYTLTGAQICSALPGCWTMEGIRSERERWGGQEWVDRSLGGGGEEQEQMIISRERGGNPSSGWVSEFKMRAGKRLAWKSDQGTEVKKPKMLEDLTVAAKEQRESEE